MMTEKMKRNLVIALVCLFVSMMLFSSCVDNDEKYLEVGLPISTTIGTLNDAGDGRLYIDSDLGNTLYVKNSEMLSSTGFEAGQRIYAEFPAPMVNKTPFVGEVELLYAYAVKVKDVVALTDANREEIGDDPIDVYSIWNSKNYLNVQFHFLTNGPDPHYINLVTVDGSQNVNGYVYLEFRHNANGNKPLKDYLGIVSFDISEYMEDPAVKGFMIRVNSYGKEHVITVPLADSEPEKVARELGDASLVE